VWGDPLLNKTEHRSITWKLTHDRIAAELASLATGAGVRSIAVMDKIPLLYAIPQSRD
jgi:hypothetical protein